MTDNLTISKVRPEKTSMDFRELRQLGIQHLEQFGTNVWTDFNLHDPGITIMEVLCYAITDLSYRTNFPIQDLLAAPSRSNGQQKKAFFTADEILTNCPVTELDFRKLLIDLSLEVDEIETSEQKEGKRPKNVDRGFRPVKNAWLFKGLERNHPSYLHTIYHITPEEAEAIKNQHPEYTILPLSFDPSERKDIFERRLTFLDSFQLSDEQKATLADFARQNGNGYFFQLSAADFDQFKKNNPVFSIFYLTSEQTIRTETLTDFLSTWQSRITISLTDQQTCFLCKAATKNSVHLQPQEFSTTPDPSYNPADTLIWTKGLYDLYLELDESIDPTDQVTVNRIIEAERAIFNANRNLCEDALNISVVDTKTFGIKAEIVVEPDADIDQIQAEVFFNIQEFLTPRINFYMLEELMEDPSFSCEDIFNGPMLHHGFIKNSDLLAAKLRDKVFTSDLYQIVMDIPGVRSIKCLEIGFCDDNNVLDIAPHPCLIINPEDGTIINDPKAGGVVRSVKYKPILEQACSSIFFNIGNTRTIADQRVVNDKLALFQEIRKRPDIRANSEIKVAAGRYRNLDNYISIQNEFPHTYHVGPEGISNTATDQRKAQAKQLKGYLLFFDQLLANYLAQLGSVRDLLSVEQDVNQATAFYHALYKVPGVKDLLKSFSGDDEEAWGNFVADPNNDYIAALKRMVENESEQKNRKNAFLDHLLARFGEQFTDYALSLYKANSNSEMEANSRPSIEQTLSEKAAFLKEVPTLGKTRGKAFNYRAKDCGKPDIWDSQNVAGLKKRVARLLGFQETDRKTLSCQPDFKINVQRLTKGRSKYYKLFVWQSDGEAIFDKDQFLLEGTKEYEKKRNATRDIASMFNALFNEAQSIVRLDPQAEQKLRAEQPQPSPKDQIFRLYVKDEDEEFVARSILLTQTEAQKLKTSIQTLAFPESCSKEGFHLLEHLLLRPVKEDYELLQPFSVAPYCLSEDPYSFWITVIVPNWMNRFKDENAQYFFEQTFRQETPAHIGLRFLWVNHEQMYEFETTYLRWLKSLNENDNEKDIKTNTNALVVLLNSVG